jgi:hypothetical protein
MTGLGVTAGIGTLGGVDALNCPTATFCMT